MDVGAYVLVQVKSKGADAGEAHFFREAPRAGGEA